MPFASVRQALLCALIASLMSVIAAQSATAQDSSATPTTADGTRVSKSFEFYPSDSGFGTYFDPTIEIGASAELTVLIANSGEGTQGLRTYAVDAFTAPGGGFAAAEHGTSQNEVTSWLDYPEETFTLDPGKGVERTFTITVPKGTAPGQYITAVAGEHAEASAVEGSGTFTQKLRYVVPVFITVPGETTAGFEVGDITTTTSEGAIVVAVDLENTGDVRVRPEGSIDLVDADSELAVSIPVEMESIYAHDGTTLTVGTTQALPPGDYTVEVDLSDKETKTTTSGTSAPVHIDLAATPVPQAIAIVSASVEPGPDADNVQFAVVDATIANTGEPVTNAQLSLLVSKDGEEIESFPISQSLALPGGDTEVNTRYIPLEGWSSGEWTFELLLETVEGSGAAVVVASQPIEGSITIP
jgi:hypothetical protein